MFLLKVLTMSSIITMTIRVGDTTLWLVDGREEIASLRTFRINLITKVDALSMRSELPDSPIGAKLRLARLIFRTHSISLLLLELPQLMLGSGRELHTQSRPS
jgi:hypothetical protein